MKNLSPLVRAVLFAVAFFVVSIGLYYFRGEEDLQGKITQNLLVGSIAAVPMYFLFESQANDDKA